jgi:hypothetical protein
MGSCLFLRNLKDYMPRALTGGEDVDVPQQVEQGFQGSQRYAAGIGISDDVL